MKKIFQIFLNISLIFVVIFLITNSLLNVNRIYFYLQSDTLVNILYSQAKYTNHAQTDGGIHENSSRIKMRCKPALKLDKFDILLQSSGQKIEVNKIRFLLYFVNFDINSHNLDKYLIMQNLDGNSIELKSTDKFIFMFNFIRHLTIFLIALILTPIIFFLLKFILKKINHLPTAELQNRFLIATFCILLIFPQFAKLFPSPNYENIDNRSLATAPELSVKNLNEFPTLYENYFNDNFGFRTQLIKTYFLLKYKLFKTSTLSLQNDKAYFGKDDFIFYKLDNEYNDVQSKVRFTQQELENIKKDVLSEDLYLKNKNIKFFVVIAPNKSTIYRDELPIYLKYSSSRHRIDQIIDLFKDTDVNIVDLRPVLLSAKKNRRIYCKTDTHWNQAGAFLGYKAIIKEIQKDYPTLKALSLNDFKIENEKLSCGDLTTMLGLKGILTETIPVLHYNKNPHSTKISNVKFDSLGSNIDVLKYENKPQNAPNVMVFRDSFFTSIVPMFAETFKNTIYIKSKPDNKVIEKEKPDIVIMEIVERNIDKL